MASTFSLNVTCTGAGPRTLSADMRREWGQDVLDVLRKIVGGASTAGSQLVVVDGAGSASLAITFTGNGTATDTVTLGGVALTAVASGATNNQWNVGASPSAAATNLAACINASTTFKGVLSAVAASAVVTVTCLLPSVVGNLITAAKSSTSISALPSAALSGGTGNQALTLVY